MYKSHATIIVSVFTILSLAVCDVAAKGKAGAPAIEKTTIEAAIMEIDFGAAAWPPFVDSVSGISDRFGGIRVTDATISPSLTISLKEALPKKFTLVLDGYAMPRNGNKAVKVMVGTVAKEIRFQKEYVFGSSERPFELIRVDFRTNEPSKTIIIIPPNPVTYMDAGWNDPNPAKWGLGLRLLKIIPN